MNWETIVEHLRAKGYTGDETLEAVRTHLKSEGFDTDNIEDKDGNAVCLDDVYASRKRAKLNIGETQLVRENAELRDKLEAKQVEDDLTGKRVKITHIRDCSEDDRSMGFKGLGEFVAAVHKAAQVGGRTDERLTKASLSSYANEGAGADGGFMVPSEFVDRIYENVFAGDSLLAMTDQITTGRNSIEFVSDETTPWGSSGVRVYWTEEAAAQTQTKPVLKYNTLRLNKVSALVPASGELLSDAPAVESLIASRAGDALSYTIDDSILHGTGAGQPLGVMNSGSTVTVAKESGQAADTIVAANILKMYSRMLMKPGGNPVWLCSHDSLPELMNLSLNNNPLYLPSMQLADAPYGTLLGRPIIITQHCETVGDVGDILFVDLSQYVTATKAGGVEAARSMHLWFDQDVEAFRFSTRVAGQPWMTSAVDSDNSVADVSPFVNLAARA